MTLPVGGYAITIQKTRLVVKENEKHFIEMTAKVGKQLLSMRLLVTSVKWRKAKKGGDSRDWSWYDRQKEIGGEKEDPHSHENHLAARIKFEKKLNLEKKEKKHGDFRHR